MDDTGLSRIILQVFNQFGWFLRQVILPGYNGSFQLFFGGFSGLSSDGSAAFGNILAFVKGFRLLILGNLGRYFFAQHRKDQFQIGHMIPKILTRFGQSLDLFILRRRHAECRFEYFRLDIFAVKIA